MAYCYYYVSVYQAIDSYPIPKTAMGFLSIPALHYLVRLPRFEKVRMLSYLGAFSFPIYLMNTIVIGTLKGAAFKLLIWDYYQFYVLAPFLFVGGLFVPILIKKHLLRFVPALDKIIY